MKRSSIYFNTIVLFTISISQQILARPTSKPSKKQAGTNIKSESDALAFLNKYGYNECANSAEPNGNSRTILCQTSKKSMIEDFQATYGLPITGKLDRKTLQHMSAPRCGVKDKPRQQLAFTAKDPWPKKTFKWKLVEENLPSFGVVKLRQQIREAFNDWTKHAPIVIEEATRNEQADFNLAFVDRHRPEGGISDGPGRTLAYAYLPTGGIIRFDSEEPWTDKYVQEGFNYRIVASHEIGHALGLDHSSLKSSLMYPTYQLFQREKILSKDDIDGIQFLYGKRVSSTSTKKTPDYGTRPTWVQAANGIVPSNAVVGGQENGLSVYVVRCKTRNGKTIPGKLVQKSKAAECPQFGVEIHTKYEVLTHPSPERHLKWSKVQGMSIPQGALLVGDDSEYRRYAARMHHPKGSIFLGKYIMPNRAFYYPY